MIGWSEKEQKDDDVVCFKLSSHVFLCFTYITTFYLILRL